MVPADVVLKLVETPDAVLSISLLVSSSVVDIARPTGIITEPGVSPIVPTVSCKK